MSRGRSSATAPARADGEPSGNVNYMSKHGARESCRAMKRPTPRGREQGCNTSSWRRSSPVPSGVWGHEAAIHCRLRDPQRPMILAFKLPHPSLGTGILRQGCGMESPTVKSEQPAGTAREDLADRRYRLTPGATMRCGGGFSSAVSLIT
jgi:hypothetical protein